MAPGAEETRRIFWGLVTGWPVTRMAKSLRASRLGTGDKAAPSGTEIHGTYGAPSGFLCDQMLLRPEPP